MLKTTLPLRRYAVADYPHLATDSIGAVIPIGYGTLTGLVPVEIDTTTDKYKILDQAVSEITAIRSATKNPLVLALDYTQDLALAEFTLIKPAYVSAPSTYYFAIDCDYAQSETNYIGLGRNANLYAGGTSYAINSGGSWQADMDDYDLRFQVWGKDNAAGAEHAIPGAENTGSDATASVGLNDTADRTKIGQSFTPDGSHYITKVTIYVTRHGTLTGKNIRLTIYSDMVGTQVGLGGVWLAIGTGGTTLSPTIAESNEDETLTCDVKAPSPTLNQVAGVLQDVVTTVMGKSATLLDATELTNLDTDRTQPLKVHLPETTTFGDFVAKLESGQMWKLVPLQDGSYGTIVYEIGEPGNTPHFRDHDFLSFKMEIDTTSIRQAATVFYDRATVTPFDHKAILVSSQVAKFFYANETSMEVETFLRDAADADALADSYLARYEVPIIRVLFEVHGWALDLLPGRDKVKITRTRAAYAGGNLDGVLFRITKVTKKPETNVVAVEAAIWGNSAT